MTVTEEQIKLAEMRGNDFDIDVSTAFKMIERNKLKSKLIKLEGDMANEFNESQDFDEEDWLASNY